MTQHSSDNPDADGHAFRRALGMFATGITVVTALSEDGTPVGLTVNSFNSVSLHPPLVVWSLSNHVGIRRVMERCSHYAVNVLAYDQEAVSRRFAGKVGERFTGLAWHKGTSGAPLLPGCCAHFEVRNVNQHEGGDHLVFIGEVERFERFDREPLVYFRGRYRQLAEGGDR